MDLVENILFESFINHGINLMTLEILILQIKIDISFEKCLWSFSISKLNSKHCSKLFLIKRKYFLFLTCKIFVNSNSILLSIFDGYLFRIVLNQIFRKLFILLWNCDVKRFMSLLSFYSVVDELLVSSKMFTSDWHGSNAVNFENWGPIKITYKFATFTDFIIINWSDLQLLNFRIRMRPFNELSFAFLY